MVIKDVLAQFLSEQRSKLASKTYRDYESVMDLFEKQLGLYRSWCGDHPRDVLHPLRLHGLIENNSTVCLVEQSSSLWSRFVWRKARFRSNWG
jgi:hypothetical protein